MGVGHEAVKLWSGILRAADSLVHVLREHDPAAVLGVFPKLAGLHGHVLAVVCSAHSAVDGDSRCSHAPFLSFGGRFALASRGLILGFLDGVLNPRAVEDLADSARGNLLYPQ